MSGNEAVNDWREAAWEYLPWFRETITEVEDVREFWFELSCAFEQAYHYNPREHRRSGDETVIASVYKYASWCLHHPEPDGTPYSEVLSAVIGNFYERLPKPNFRSDVPRYLSTEDFEELEQARVFRYWLNDDSEHAAFVVEFRRAKAAQACPPRRKKT